MKTLSHMLLAAAASSLAIAPIAAQAGTRAGEGTSLYSVSAPGKGRAAKGESFAGVPLFVLLIGGALITAGFFTAAGVIGDSDDGEKSPGT